jgi:hypothetical protein
MIEATFVFSAGICKIGGKIAIVLNGGNIRNLPFVLAFA